MPPQRLLLLGAFSGFGRARPLPHDTSVGDACYKLTNLEPIAAFLLTFRPTNLSVRTHVWEEEGENTGILMLISTVQRITTMLSDPIVVYIRASFFYFITPIL